MQHELSSRCCSVPGSRCINKSSGPNHTEIVTLPTSVAGLVEKLLDAKRNLRLARELKRLDTFDCLALDDIGYVQHDRAEMEVLFALLAERYERRSVMITSNLVFSKWDQIFKDPMTTAAAIDRVVHHAVVLEFTGPSVRAEAAEQRAALAKRGTPEVADQ